MLRSLTTILFATLALAIACPALTNTSPPPAASAKPESAEKTAAENAPVATRPAKSPADGEKTRVMVIPIQGPIDTPVLYTLRRGLKDAIEQKINIVVLDMNTRGGISDTAFAMMEAIDRFPGRTFTFINNEAGSAGAFIAASTKEIWYAPKSIVGSAAAVNADGSDLGETMRLKTTSFLAGKVRTYSDDKGRYHSDVLRAMMDKDFELKIDEEIINPKGVLLTITDKQALKRYGNPPETLFGIGSATSIADLLLQKYGSSNFELTRLEVTWSERLAQWLSVIKPVLLGLGMLALFIEFKTPGFGFFGIAGIVLLAIVFLSSYVAGLSGHEPMIVFALGLVLVVLELLFFPGLIIPLAAGLLMMLGSLIWAMADFWPGDPVSIAWTTDTLATPLYNLGAGLVIAAVLITVFLRYMPKSWFWDRIVLTGEVTGAAQIAGLAPEAAHTLASLVGKRALVVTPLRPFGQVEIDGRRYEARHALGTVERGTVVIVRGHTDFSLEVEPEENA